MFLDGCAPGVRPDAYADPVAPESPAGAFVGVDTRNDLGDEVSIVLLGAHRVSTMQCIARGVFRGLAVEGFTLILFARLVGRVMWLSRA